MSTTAEPDQELLTAFQDAKNSLVEMTRATPLWKLAQSQRDRSVFDPALLSTPALTQTSFLKHAYIGLVWLREVVRRCAGSDAQKSIDEWMDAAVARIGDDVRLVGDRQGTEGTLRTIRNAIAHGRVTFNGDEAGGIGLIRFTDGPKKNLNSVEIEAPMLGYLADQYIYAVSNALYGEPSSIRDPGR